ncbi:hypothetical protein [Herpetosiphon llansteffanensis]|uniref:hypothetical protein n=1 Tax=Herpetosiphon llansteffanensis TaxID=2094568 RepID=UPI000D7B9940|nr:hypothetical protein [Herpetosiphon llansteffanensis]
MPNTTLPLINQTQLHQELALRQKQLAERRNYGRIEQVARCLHLLNDESAKPLFCEAAALHETVFREPTSFDTLTRANLYRLGGEKHRAQRWFQATTQYVATRLVRYPRNTTELTKAAIGWYFLGDYDRVQECIDQIRNDPDGAGGIEEWLTTLMQLATAPNQQQAQQFVTTIEDYIQRHQVSFSDTGSVTIWDWYELAYRYTQQH